MEEHKDANGIPPTDVEGDLCLARVAVAKGVAALLIAGGMLGLWRGLRATPPGTPASPPFRNDPALFQQRWKDVRGVRLPRTPDWDDYTVSMLRVPVCRTTAANAIVDAKALLSGAAARLGKVSAELKRRGGGWMKPPPPPPCSKSPSVGACASPVCCSTVRAC